jgi:hypothetical protein
MITNPRNHKGQYVSNKCKNPLCSGKLVQVTPTLWECDGLVDPDDPNKELQACNEFVDSRLNLDEYPPLNNGYLR